MRTFLFRFFIYTIIVLIWSCASRVAPDGGPKDTEPPKVLSTLPDSFSRNVNPSKLEFEFDEFVQLKDGGTGILISPPMEKRPEAVLQGKSLVLKLVEPLEENTTYTITVSKSIADLSENNALKPYSMVFSTGDVIDSLGCSGKIIDAFSGKPLEGIMLLLYTSNEDSLPQTTLPRYFGVSDKDGVYFIPNIKEGTYTVFALNDENSNYLYDQVSESIGFIKDEIKIDSQNVAIPLIRMSIELPKRQRLIKSSLTQPFTLTLKYALPPDSLELTDFDGNNIKYYESDKSTADSLVLHLEKLEDDSLKLFVKSNYVDSIRTDTLNFKVKQQGLTQQKRRSASKPDTILVVSSNIEQAKLLPNDYFTLKTNYPASLNDTLKSFWRIEEDTIDAILSKGTSFYEFIAEPPSAPGRSIEFISFPGLIEDIYGRRSDTLRIDFRKMDLEETGNIEIFFDDLGKENQNLILEVLNPKSKVVFSSNLAKSDSLIIRELNPGSYLLRVFSDVNFNGVWDPANYSSKSQAELTFHYAEPIVVRAGWDIAVEWQIRKPKELKAIEE